MPICKICGKPIKGASGIYGSEIGPECFNRLKTINNDKEVFNDKLDQVEISDEYISTYKSEMLLLRDLPLINEEKQANYLEAHKNLEDKFLELLKNKPENIKKHYPVNQIYDLGKRQWEIKSTQELMDVLAILPSTWLTSAIHESVFQYISLDVSLGNGKMKKIASEIEAIEEDDPEATK